MKQYKKETGITEEIFLQDTNQSCIFLDQKLSSLRVDKFLNIFKDTHRENIPSNKTKAFVESMNMVQLGNQIFIKSSYNELNFQKNKIVSDKTPLFPIGPFCTSRSIFLNIVFDRSVFYGNVTFSIIVLRTKKWYSSFSKKLFASWKTCFKVRAMKTFKVFCNCQIKIC